MSTPARSAQISSWSAAAARNVSPAQSSTFLPSAFRRLASLPMVVVLPTPLTPMTRMTLGCVLRSRAVSPTSSFSARMSRSASFTSSARVSSFWYTRFRSCCTASDAVSTPTSARISASSNSS